MVRYISFWFVVFISIQSVIAQQVNLINNAYARKHSTLNGLWHIIIDPYDNGYYDYRYQPRTTGGYFENRKQVDKSELIEYNFDKSHMLQVPGDWNSQKGELFYYEGTIWYKKDFNYEKKNDRRLFIYFGAANYEAHVYINGKKVGFHRGGFTPFNFEITDQVISGSNFVIVKVDNRRYREAVPTVNTDWWNYGGLTRDVFLLEVPDTFIEDYFIQLEKGSADQIVGWIKLNNSQKVHDIKLQIPEKNIEVTFKTDNRGYAKIEFQAELELWSPQNPKLYDVILTAGEDRIQDQIGFRTLETQNSEILINGKPLFLKGICIHEQAPLRDGRAYSKEDAIIFINWVKQLNGNFIRLAHYPHNEHIIRLADQQGTLVWSEIPVYWTILWDNQETLKNARQQLAEMIARDKNRASVIIWSVGNETPLIDERLKFMSELAVKAKEMDPTRFISAALERHYIDDKTLMIDDPLGDYLDVIGCNEYIGWYDGLPDKAIELTWQSIYKKPHIISEYGAGALQGYHGDRLTRWTEEYQEDLYKKQLQMLDRVPFVSGMTPWILMDFRSPRRPLPGIQDMWNRKGIISERGIKKKAFYVLQNYYRDK